MEKNITITDVVDLMIEKKIKEVKEQISLKEKELDDYFKKQREGITQKAKNLKAFLEKHCDPEGLRHFARISGFMGFGPFGIIRSLSKEETREQDFEELVMMGLVLNEDAGDFNHLKNLMDELDSLEDKIREIRNSRDKIISEVTLNHLTSIDADFADKIELLTERIFNNNKNQLN